MYSLFAQHALLCQEHDLKRLVCNVDYDVTMDYKVQAQNAP